MKIHEYQAKQLFEEFGIPTPRGLVCENSEEITKAIAEIKVPLVVKAQVHSGARGKAGGIKLAKTEEEAEKIAGEILGMKLVSTQAGEIEVKKIMIVEAIKIKRELYLSITFDRANENIAIIYSNEGGTDIEQISKETPEKIYKISADVFSEPNTDDLMKKTGLPVEIQNRISDIIKKLYRLYIEKDATLAEINPLVITEDDKVIAADAKINIDDNALYRQEEIASMTDKNEEDKLETEAKENNLNYIKLDGTIGCMVNGAGLAMATMDIIKLAGKNPANFLDVGGGAGSEKIAKAFEILMKDKNVEAVFINIFGGILRCDLLAEGITKACKEKEINVPLILRLEGTNKEQGTEILRQSGLKYTFVKDLKEAVEVIKGI